jgi:hypothetical protein
MTWNVCVIFEGKYFEDYDTHTDKLFALQGQSAFVNCENMYRPRSLNVAVQGPALWPTLIQTGVGLPTANGARASLCPNAAKCYL